MISGPHIFGNHGKPSKVNNFELHPADKASTAPLEATRTLRPTAVFGAPQESVAVPAGVCPNSAVLIGTCLLFIFVHLGVRNEEISHTFTHTHTLSLILSREIGKKIHLAGKTTRPRRGVTASPRHRLRLRMARGSTLSAGTFAARYNLQADHLNSQPRETDET